MQKNIVYINERIRKLSMKTSENEALIKKWERIKRKNEVSAS